MGAPYRWKCRGSGELLATYGRLISMVLESVSGRPVWWSVPSTICIRSTKAVADVLDRNGYELRMEGKASEVWAKRIERWRDSGLTATEFAAEVGVNAKSLSHWKWRLHKGAQQASDGFTVPSQFVEVVAGPEMAVGVKRAGNPEKPSKAQETV